MSVEKKKRITLILGESLLKMAESLMKDKGFSTFPSVFYQSLREFHSRTYPAYAQSKRAQNDGLTESERICVALAEELEARIYVKHGVKRARSFKYHHGKRDVIDVPLLDLTDAMVNLQYHPSREIIVEEYQKRGRCNYDINEKP